jgi:hypothetical protein
MAAEVREVDTPVRKTLPTLVTRRARILSTISPCFSPNRSLPARW